MLTPAEIDAFRSRLIADLKALDTEDILGLENQKTVALDQQSVGRLSRMDALQQQAMAQATRRRRDVQRQRIRGALARIDADEFGFCEDCGEEIALKRLELDPATPVCVNCASG